MSDLLDGDIVPDVHVVGATADVGPHDGGHLADEAEDDGGPAGGGEAGAAEQLREQAVAVTLHQPADDAPTERAEQKHGLCV